MVDIPLDILDLVFEELQPPHGPISFGGGPEPKKSLRSCALVCHAWWPLATSHVFRKVVYSFV